MKLSFMIWQEIRHSIIALSLSNVKNTLYKKNSLCHYLNESISFTDIHFVEIEGWSFGKKSPLSFYTIYTSIRPLSKLMECWSMFHFLKEFIQTSSMKIVLLKCLYFRFTKSNSLPLPKKNISLTKILFVEIVVSSFGIKSPFSLYVVCLFLTAVKINGMFIYISFFKSVLTSKQHEYCIIAVFVL